MALAQTEAALQLAWGQLIYQNWTMRSRGILSQAF